PAPLPATTLFRAGHPRVLELHVPDALEKLHVLGVGPGPAALDVVDAEPVQAHGDAHLVLRGEGDALALGPVPQSGVKQLDAFRPLGHRVAAPPWCLGASLPWRLRCCLPPLTLLRCLQSVNPVPGLKVADLVRVLKGTADVVEPFQDAVAAEVAVLQRKQDARATP